MCYLESRFGPFGDNVSFSARFGAWFVPNTPYSKKTIWTHPMVLLGEDPQKKDRFRLFRDSANLDVR